ncbi:dynein heavy chain 17, axonemal [Trichonephila clavipes]|nr:dynein heavy chain 17, axonemal [Trichonephila clavipes]
MRLIFEVATLERATPATVSRGGVLYLDTADVGWNPYVVSWIERRSVQSEKANLIIFFDKYVPPCLEAMTKRFKTVLPIPDICYVQNIFILKIPLLIPPITSLDPVLSPGMPADPRKHASRLPNELYELYFVFCCVWAFGSGLTLTSGADGRLEFSNWFLSEFKSVPISGAQAPGRGGADAPTVFDYYIDTKRTPGTDQRDSTDSVHDGPAHLEGAPHHAGGASGCGKTSVIRSTLEALDRNPHYLVVTYPSTSYTSSATCPAGHGTSSREKSGQEFWTTWTKK